MRHSAKALICCAVMAVAAKPFIAVTALMSAWIPAPPPESEPAIDRTRGGFIP